MDNNERKYGRLYLIPSPLGECEPLEVIPSAVLQAASRLTRFVVEETRTARRFLSKAGMKGRIDTLEFHELNEHTSMETVEGYLSLFEDGCDVGLISEAGLPAVADPGARLVALAHRNGIEVVPFVGPSSLMLALMSSGMNGQSFAFCGYLPVKPEERRDALHSIERHSAVSGQTQIFIETPYRNDSMLADIVRYCSPSTMVNVAANITMPDAFISAKTVGQWAKEISCGFSIGKRPCVFVLSAGHQNIKKHYGK